jgi:cell division transport system ATP-binding protein
VFNKDVIIKNIEVFVHMELIRLSKVTKRYKNGVTAIAELDLKIKKGDFVFIIGNSGSGKSTLIKMLYREEKPTMGKIIVGGIDVARLINRRVYRLRRKLGIVFQDFKLLPKATVYENVAFALEVLGEARQDIRQKVIKALELVDLKDKVKYYPDQLSGGEQQRVAIARAIVNEPKLLICDEPTGNLDPKISMEIMRVLETINKLGTTVIMATHDKQIVDEMQKRVVVLDAGRLIKDFEKGTYDYEVV